MVSNAVAPILTQLSQPLVITSSASTTPRILLLTIMNPVTSGPSKLRISSTGRTDISRTSQPLESTLPPRSAILILLITATASSNGYRRQPSSIAVSENMTVSSSSFFQTVSLIQRLTLSFLTAQDDTAKTTGHTTQFKRRSANIPPTSHAFCRISR